MRYPLLITLVISLISFQSGCTPQAEEVVETEQTEQTMIGGVGVVDLDEVSRKTGTLDKITSQLKSQETSLNQQLLQYNSQLQKTVQERLEKLQPELRESGNKELQTQLVQHRTQARNQAAKKLSQSAQQMMITFRQEVKPYVSEAARKRGLTMIIPKNESLFVSYDYTVDVTEDVIQLLLEKRRQEEKASTGEVPKTAQTVGFDKPENNNRTN